MVDFDNEATVGIPAVDVEKISILQRRYDFIEAYEEYKKVRLSGSSAPLSIVRARLISLFLELQPCLKRRVKKPEDKSSLLSYEDMKEKLFEGKLEERDILIIFLTINTELDEMRLTRVDNQKVYNSRNVEEENKVKGY